MCVLAAASVAWLGGQILGEYTIEGFVPVAGGAMLGVGVCAAADLPWRRREAPPWVGGVVVAAAGLGEALAVEIDTADLRPWPWEGYAAVLAACCAAGSWFVSRRRACRDARV